MHPIISVLDSVFDERRGLLPARFDGDRVRVLLVSISGQEADLRHRDQLESPGGRDLVTGPALGLLQFEQGTRRSRGGVWGVFLHPASRPWLQHACERAGVEFEPRAIWLALEHNDALAFAVARCLLLTDPRPLPDIGAVWPSWEYYNRNWRPGKPHPEVWATNYARARRIVLNGANE